MTGQAIELCGVTKTFDGAAGAAVAPLDLTLGAGEITVLIGPSGCGKTTTMRMINRLIEPTAGVITIGGVDIREQSTTELRRGHGVGVQLGLRIRLDEGREPGRVGVVGVLMGDQDRVQSGDALEPVREVAGVEQDRRLGFAIGEPGQQAGMSEVRQLHQSIVRASRLFVAPVK